MINEFMPDFSLGVVGAWSAESRYNDLWGCDIPDVIRPTMFVLDVTDHTHELFDTDLWDYPIIAVHKIPSFRDAYTSTNKVKGKYFRGYCFVSHGTFYDRNAYFMLVYVEKLNNDH